MRRLLLLGLSGLLASCGGSGSGSGGPVAPGPDRTVASVTVTPSGVSLDVDATLLLTATARNAAGETLSGIAFTWQSTSPGTATVDGNGLVTGRSPGPVTIQASAQDRTGSASLTVEPRIVIASVAPDPLVEGQAATITGSGFAPTPAGNRVTIGGIDAIVTAATPTRLTVTVPSDCQPPGRVAVRVSVGVRTTPDFHHSLQPAVAPFDLPVGTPFFLAPAANGCMQFPSSAGMEYLVGAQSTAEAVSTLTPLRIRALSGIPIVGDLIPAAGRAGREFGTPGLSGPGLLLHRHRQAESRIREMERDLLRDGTTSLAAARHPVARRDLRPAVEVGDEFEVRIPDRAGTNLCTDFVTVTVKVRHVSQRAVFAEDLENPMGGLSDAQYTDLAATFDGPIHSTITGHFGATTDVDGNGRVVVVLSKRLNEWFAATGAIGFVLFGNLFSRTDCPASNVAEIFYSVAPDPSGLTGPPITAAEMLNLEKILLAHEVTHLIQQAGRIMTSGATSLMSTWQSEGQATYAEEIVGFAARSRSAGQNYGPAVLFEDVALNWHLEMFTDLVMYFGFQTPESRVTGAPEQCSFLGLPSQGNSGPCIGRMAYGVSWSFFRWLSDRLGPAAAGAFHRGIIQNTRTGYDLIEDVAGVDIEELLALWAASLYVDDRYAGMDPSLLWSSWDLFSIDQSAVQTARLSPRAAGGSVADLEIQVRAGSSAYYLLRGNPASLRVRGASTSLLPPNVQIWAVRVR